MRILIISYDFYPNIGGVAQHVLNLTKYLKKDGHRVFVLTLRYSLNQKFVEKIDGVKVFRILTFNISKIRGLMFLFFAAFFGFLFSLFKRIDIVHTHTLIPDSVVGLFICSKKKIFTNHSSQFLELYESRNKQIIKFIFKFVMKFYDLILAPSEELKEKSEKFFNKPSIFIPNGVDTDFFEPADQEKKRSKKQLIFEKWNIEPRKFIIFCPRRLEPKNGVEFFVEAIKFLSNKRKDFWTIISGNEYIPKYAKKIKNMIKDLEKFVLFTGPIPNKEMINYYQASDIVVLPSLMEATSISGLEALSCGVPVIGTKVGGIPFIVKDKFNGLLVEPRNSEEIFKAISLLLNDDKEREILSRNARDFILQNFSWDKIIKDIEKIYQDDTRKI
jgi:glycosyltransferase involved in cell wall biosynthesis